MRLMLALTVCALVPMNLWADKDASKGAGVLNFKMKNIDGKEMDLSKLKGKVVLFVNVASQCGLTPQYKQLQSLHDAFADKGLVIVGVPANEFGAQEPGSNSEIKEFCSSKYGVKFPMVEKVVVKGDGICPLYDYLTSKKTNPEFAGEIKWNFTKFLVSRDGKVVARFEPRVRPDAKEVMDAIENELKK